MCNLSPRLHSVSSTVFYQLDSHLKVWLQCVSLAVICQLRCNLSAQLPLVHFPAESVQYVSLTVSSANCSSEVICHLSSCCHLRSNSSSQLQFVCSAASCSSGVICHISHNLLCSSARTSARTQWCVQTDFVPSTGTAFRCA